MKKSVSRSNVRLTVALATAALCLLALAVPAAASDPATDQYAPSTPSGGGSVPSQSDDDASFGGGTGGSDSSSGGNDGGSTGAPAPAATTPSSTSPSAPAGDTGSSASASTAGHHSAGQDRDHKTLAGFAAQAEHDRAALAAATAGAKAPDLARSEGDGDSGLGDFLWVVLGLMLASAVAVTVAGRRQGGHPA